MSLFALFLTGAVGWYKRSSIGPVLELFLALEGTVLLASAFSPTGLLPPPKGSIMRKVRWFCDQQAGVPLQYNQPMFYRGLFCLFLAAGVGALFD